MRKIFVKTKNVKNFSGIINNLIDKSISTPKMGLIYGAPGLGKSHTAIWWATKNNSPFRNLTIDDDTTRCLAELFIKQIPSKEDFVFKMDGIDDINKYFEESILKPISEKLELGEFNSIDLTHNFVNMLLTQNVPITYIRKVCGYPSIKTFLEVYNSRLQESEKEYYNPLDMK